MLTSTKRNPKKSRPATTGKYDHLYQRGMTPRQKQKIRRRVRREAKVQ